MKKRLLSTLLAICLALSLLPTWAAASSTAVRPDVTPDGDYWENMTRQEALDMLKAVKAGTETRDMVFIYYKNIGDAGITGLYNSIQGYKKFLYVYADMGKGFGQEGGTLKGEPEFEALFPNMTVEQAGLVYKAGGQCYAESQRTDSANAYYGVLMPYVTIYGLENGATPPSGSSDPGTNPGGDNPGTDPGTDPGTTGPTLINVSPEAWAVLRLTNIHRMDTCPYRTDGKTREPLSVFAELQKSADERADEIRQKYDPGHKRLDGRSWITIYPEVGINGYTFAAENLASGQKNSAAAFFAWYNSTMHHRNMDNASAVHMGAGYAATNNWSENFVTNRCSFRDLKLSKTSINGQAGVDLETLLLFEDIEVSARCTVHGTSILPLIAGMCSSGYDPNCASEQKLTVTYQGLNTTLTIRAAGDSTPEACVAHDWSKKTTQATCTEDGVETKTCNKCGAVETKTTEKAAHKYADGVCTVCQDSIEAVVESDMIAYTSSDGLSLETVKTWDAKQAEDYVKGELKKAEEENAYPSNFKYDVKPAGDSEDEYFKKPVDGTPANPNGEEGYFKYIITITDPSKPQPEPETPDDTDDTNDTNDTDDTNDTGETGETDTPASRRARAGETPGETGILTLILPAVPYDDGGTATPPTNPTQPSPPSHTHSWNSGRVTKEPTCTASGVRTFSCSGCAQTKTETIPALGHAWGGGEVTTPATCGADGVLTKTCTRTGCNETRTEAIPATGAHDWDEGKFSGDCEEGGVRTYKCTVCGETKTETVAAGEHTWDGGKLSSGSCTDGGTQIYTCTVCGGTRTEDLPADGHTWDSGAVTTEPACTESGVKTFTCGKCGETKTEAVPALGHRPDSGTVTKAASCTENGVKTYACTVCKETLRTEIIPATGHNFTGSAESGYICQNGCGAEIPSELKNVYDEIQDKIQPDTATVITTGPDGKTEKEEDVKQRVVVLPASTPADRNDENAVKGAVETYLTNMIQNMIKTAEGASGRVVSKLVKIDVKRGKYQGEPGAWHIYQVVLSREAVRAADVLTTEEIWVFVPDKRETVSNSEETYYISVPKSDGGEIIPNTRYAAYGERVTLSAHPGRGYELDSLTVKDIRGRELALRELSGGQYAFYMPACKVTVEAAFIKAGAGDAPASPDDAIPGTNHTTADPSAEPFTGLGTPGISGIVLRPGPMPFTDVPAGSWYYNGAEYMWKHYLMSGVSDTRFAPNATTSRAMIWTVLARMNNVRTDAGTGGAWYERGMIWAVEKGLTDGTNPMGDITREQLAAMLWRNAGQPGGSSADLSRFSDAGSISGYAKGAVQWAVTVGILNGSDGKLNPKGTATRAEVAVMIMRYGERMA